MPRARVPRTAVDYLDVVDKRGLSDIQRVFGCSRRAAEDLVLPARRCVAQGRRYEVLEPPSSAAAVAAYRRPGRIGNVISDAQVRELAAGIDPPELKHLTADERYALQRERQDQERRAGNKSNGYPEVDPQFERHWQSLSPEERERLRTAPA